MAQAGYRGISYLTQQTDKLIRTAKCAANDDTLDSSWQSRMIGRG